MEKLKTENLVEKQKEVEDTISTFTAQSEHLIDLDPMPKPDIGWEHAFDITKRLAKVYKHESGGSVYAGFRREGITMRSDLVLVVKYPDGCCSEAIDINQELIFDKTYRPSITKSNKYAWVRNSKCLNILRGYCTPEMKIDYVKIYCILRENYDKLPVIELCSRSPLPEVYQSIADYVKSKQDGTNIYSTCDDYPLTKEDLTIICKQAGYSTEELIRQMALSGILLVDGGKQKRYQKSMRPRPGENPIRYYVFKNKETLQNQSKSSEISVDIRPAEVPTPNGAYKKWE